MCCAMCCCMLLQASPLCSCGQPQGHHLQYKQARLHELKQSSCTPHTDCCAVVATAQLQSNHLSTESAGEGPTVRSRLLCHAVPSLPHSLQQGGAGLPCGDVSIPVVVP